MKSLITFIILFGIFGYLLDLKKNKDFKNCKKSLSFHSILLFHHLLSSFFLLGILSFNLTFMKVYVFSLFILFTSWFVYDHNCLITYYNNKIADIDCKIPFRSPFTYILGEDDDIENKAWIQYLQVAIFIAITFIKIEYVSKIKSKKTI